MYGTWDLNPLWETDIKGTNDKLMLNVKASYRSVDKLQGFATAKNLLGKDSREHYGTNRIGRTCFAGIDYKF